MRRFLWCAAALAIATTASAEIYKWVDKDGNVQYSDTPPAAVQAKPMSINAAPATPSAAQPTYVEREKEYQKRVADQKDASKKEEDSTKLAAQKEADCKQATAALQGLDMQIPIWRTDASGERTYLSDEQREAEKVRAQKAMDESCRK
jgi:hypothetical protein